MHGVVQAAVEVVGYRVVEPRSTEGDGRVCEPHVGGVQHDGRVTRSPPVHVPVHLPVVMISAASAAAGDGLFVFRALA